MNAASSGARIDAVTRHGAQGEAASAMLSNIEAGSAAFFGGPAPDFSNTAVAVFKKEGW